MRSVPRRSGPRLPHTLPLPWRKSGATDVEAVLDCGTRGAASDVAIDPGAREPHAGAAAWIGAVVVLRARVAPHQARHRANADCRAARSAAGGCGLARGRRRASDRQSCGRIETSRDITGLRLGGDPARSGDSAAGELDVRACPRQPLARRDRDGGPRCGLDKGRAVRTRRREYGRARAECLALPPQLGTAISRGRSARAAVGTGRARPYSGTARSNTGVRNPSERGWSPGPWWRLALQLAALVALSLSLLGFSWLDARSRPRVLVLVDRSQSVPRAASDKAVADVMHAAKAAGSGDLQLLEFAGRPATLSANAADSVANLEPAATNIEAALDAALAADARTPFASVVIVSDGLENAGDVERALRAAREAQLPVRWIPAGRPLPETRIAEVLAPHRALVGQRMQINVQLAGRLDRPLRVKATARATDGDTQAASGQVDGEGRATVELDASRNGAVLVDVALEDPVSGKILERFPDAAVVDVVPRAAILYVQGSSGTLARSLRKGGWTLNVVPATRLDAHADALDGYHAVVLDDVAITDASPRFWNALVATVRNRGLGLMVLGGERSFARGGYRESALESVLPVSSEPAALDQPVSIVFVVDKSGSMGQGSGGVDRFQMAQRAVLETARGLTQRDSLGLVGLRRGAARADSARPCPCRDIDTGARLERNAEWRNKACTRARDGDRRARALGCRTAHVDTRHRRFRRRRTARRTARAARSFSNRNDRAGRRAGRRRKRPGAADRRGNGRCASRERGRRIAARHALRSRASPGACRARHDRRVAASGVAVLAGNAEGLASGRGLFRYPVATNRVRGRADRTRRPVDCIPKVRPGPRRSRDLWTGKLDSTMVAMARVAAARRWTDGLDQRHTRGRSRRAGRVGSAGRTAGRGRCPSRGGTVRSCRRVDNGADTDDPGPVGVHGLCRPWPVAGNAARRRSRPIHISGLYVARYPAATAPPAAACRERGLGHKPGAGRMEDRRTRQQLGPGLSCATSRWQPSSCSARSLAGWTGSRALLVRRSGRPNEVSQGNS